MRDVIQKAVEAIAAAAPDADFGRVSHAIRTRIGAEGWTQLMDASLAEVLTYLTVKDVIDIAVEQSAERR